MKFKFFFCFFLLFFFIHIYIYSGTDGKQIFKIIKPVRGAQYNELRKKIVEFKEVDEENDNNIPSHGNEEQQRKQEETPINIDVS